MEQIRFRWMDLNQLQEIEQDLLVPRSIFIEAIMARLRASESNLAYNEEDEKNQRFISFFIFFFIYILFYLFLYIIYIFLFIYFFREFFNF